MIKFTKELVEEYNNGTAKEKLSIISSFFTIVGLSIVATIPSYFVNPDKINELGIFFMYVAIDLVFIVGFLIISSLIFRIREGIKKFFPSFGLIIFYTFYVFLICGFIGALLRYGADITFLFRHN